MYIETSYPQKKGDKARLLSPVQSYTSGKCLVFWYHAYGIGKFYKLNKVILLQSDK